MVARTVGGGAKGAMFSMPGLSTAKLAAGIVGISTAENYLHSAAKGNVSAEALGKALADGTVEGVTAGLVDVAAKKVLGAQTHAKPELKPELQMEFITEAERRSYLKPDIQLFAENQQVDVGRKLEYIFGNATGTSHNIERSIEMKRILNKIGIFDNDDGRQIVLYALKNSFNSPGGIVQENGRVLKECLIKGPGGIAKMESIWADNKLITVFLYNKEWKSIK